MESFDICTLLFAACSVEIVLIKMNTSKLANAITRAKDVVKSRD